MKIIIIKQKIITLSFKFFKVFWGQNFRC
jgi:hypothetical protein